MPRQSWSDGMRKKVSQIVAKGGPPQKRRVAAFLRGLAARVSENVDGNQTRLLTAYPHMPPKIFRACIRVQYDTGLALYKLWHERHNMTPPKRIRMSAESRLAWREIVLEELGL